MLTHELPRFLRWTRGGMGPRSYRRVYKIQMVGLSESDVQGSVAYLHWPSSCAAQNATVKAGTCHGMAVPAMFAGHQCNGVAWRARAMMVQGAKLCGIHTRPYSCASFLTIF